MTAGDISIDFAVVNFAEPGLW